MSQIKRRQFLQFSASALFTVGLSQYDIMQEGNKYAQVLAQSTPRKLALLVGINAYPNGLALGGCVNDVSLQQELLIHRFGFNPQDIKTLTDGQATRQGILTAFEEHLIKQAKPGDVVVFHFSGHGDRISDKPSCDEIALNLSKECANSTFLPVDARSQSGAVRDIMGHTLFLLMSALKTENVTVVLDSCHSGGGKRGNFLVRSPNTPDLPSPSSEELEYQQQLLKKLKLSPQEFVEKRRKGIAKGVVIAGAKREQLASDATFNGFSAGAFTYLFTQYLWQQTSNELFTRALVNVSRNTKIVAGVQGNYQEPEFESNFRQKNANPPIYFTPLSSQSADAVITKVNGNQVDLWLGGIDSQTLEAFNKNTIFSVLDTQGGESRLVQLESRMGLTGRGKLLDTKARGLSQLKPGTLLQERIRSIPENVTLKIGLDDTLDTSTTQQAKQALQSIKRVQALPLRTSDVQYIFGHMTEARYHELQKNKTSYLPPVGSFGLFLPTQDKILPGSFGESNEAVSAAVTRLRPKLKSLLAARVVKQMLGNTNTSRIAVNASMTIAGSTKMLSEVFPSRGVSKVSPGKSVTQTVNSLSGDVPKLSVGTQIAFQIINKESVPVYISLLVIDSSGEMAIIFPNDWAAAKDATLLSAGQKLIIPQTGIDNFVLTIGEPFGFSEALVIASTTPLRDSLKVLKEVATSRGLAGKRGLFSVADDELLNVTNSLLDDLDSGTRGAIVAEGITLPQGVRGIDTNKLAAMSIGFEVVAKRS
ncbi:MAG: caspase family protein [Rhizonema sp. PD38]|nr:caspase family protein [Rhizonema sp. PD38]